MPSSTETAVKSHVKGTMSMMTASLLVDNINYGADWPSVSRNYRNANPYHRYSMFWPVQTQKQLKDSMLLSDGYADACNQLSNEELRQRSQMFTQH
jgi:hypothetical protein